MHTRQYSNISDSLNVAIWFAYNTLHTLSAMMEAIGWDEGRDKEGMMCGWCGFCLNRIREVPSSISHSVTAVIYLSVWMIFSVEFRWITAASIHRLGNRNVVAGNAWCPTTGLVSARRNRANGLMTLFHCEMLLFKWISKGNVCVWVCVWVFVWVCVLLLELMFRQSFAKRRQANSLWHCNGCAFDWQGRR